MKNEEFAIALEKTKGSRSLRLSKILHSSLFTLHSESFHHVETIIEEDC